MKYYTLVTGASSDIGQRICKILEESGHHLLLTDLSVEALDKSLQKMSFPDRHIILPLDFSDIENSQKKMQNFLTSNQILVSHAVFAAGIFSVKPLQMVDYSSLKKNFDVALFSVFLVIQLLSSKKINSGSLKSVVLISSVSAKVGTKGYCIYSAVKAAMVGLVKSMASELSPRTRVNAVLPGGIKTRTTKFLFDGVDEPNPRYLLGDGDPSDIAYMIEYLLSDKSRWITGQEFVVDGGFMCS